LNAAIRAVARRAFERGIQVTGVKNGWAGLLQSGDLEELTPASVRGILPLGGTILGTSRTNPLKEKGGVEQSIQLLASNGIDGLVAIGGDDTLSVAAAMSEAGYPVVGLPKTIDNDLSATEFCIGFDTAVGVVVEALDRLHTTASAHHRVMVVEVMGRDTGWVAMVGGLAGGADMILIPEFPVRLEEVEQHLHRRRGEGKDFSIIVVAEGVKIQASAPVGATQAAAAERRDAFGHVQLSRQGVGDALSTQIEEATGFETRVTVLGHLQRGGSPSPVDRIWATRLGVAATDLLAEHKAGLIPVRQNGEVAVVPLREVIRETRRVPEPLFRLQRIFG
jgi:6-phosphofructokinase 1